MTDNKRIEKRQELLTNLCKEIRALIIKFSAENYEQFSKISKITEISDRIGELKGFSYQEINELSECVELSTRALAFELGYNKQMLSQFPENSVDKMIVDELYFGKQCFESEYEIAMKMKEAAAITKPKKDSKKDLN